MQNVIDMHLHDETITRFSKHTECFFMAVSLYGHRTGEIGFPQKIPVRSHAPQGAGIGVMCMGFNEVYFNVLK